MDHRSHNAHPLASARTGDVGVATRQMSVARSQPLETPMEAETDSELMLIDDGEGLAVIGNVADVDRFLAAENLSSSTLDLGLNKLGRLLGAAGLGLELGAELSANSCRWMKLTKESAEAIAKYGLRK